MHGFILYVSICTLSGNVKCHDLFYFANYRHAFANGQNVIFRCYSDVRTCPYVTQIIALHVCLRLSRLLSWEGTILQWVFISLCSWSIQLQKCNYGIYPFAQLIITPKTDNGLHMHC